MSDTDRRGEEVRRLDIAAAISYVGPYEEGDDGWVCEVGIREDDGFNAWWQGWGPDPLAAALDCAENVFARSLTLGTPARIVAGPDRRGGTNTTWSSTEPPVDVVKARMAAS